MVYPIYLYGSQVLRQKAAEVDLQNEDPQELKALLEDMHLTMQKADGCGLAAPQIGISKRILVVDGKDLAERFPDLKNFLRKMINPVVVSQSDETSEYEEGCLSIPNVDANIVRPKVITVRYFDENLEEKEETFDNFASRMVQHELDHLDGKVFTDHASAIRKKMISSKLHNISKGKVRTAYKAVFK